MNAALQNACPCCGIALAAPRTGGLTPALCSACGTVVRPAGPPQLSHKAVASLVLGLLSIVLSSLAGLPAIVLSALALRDIRRRPTELRGARHAIGGAVAGCLLSSAFMALLLYLISGRDSSGTAALPARPVAPENAVPLATLRDEWRWLHAPDGSDPAAAEPGFHRRFFLQDYDDSGWQRSSDAESGIGYGDPVSVDLGRPPEGARHSAYFRHAFTTTEPFAGLLLHLARDDGAIVYLDGEEVARTNMPAGAKDAHRLAASQPLSEPFETAPASLPIERPLPSGRHVLAISLHNSSPTSSDLRLAEATLYGLR